MQQNLKYNTHILSSVEKHTGRSSSLQSEIIMVNTTNTVFTRYARCRRAGGWALPYSCTAWSICSGGVVEVEVERGHPALGVEVLDDQRVAVLLDQRGHRVRNASSSSSETMVEGDVRENSSVFKPSGRRGRPA